MKACPSCGDRIDDARLIACPRCGSGLDSSSLGLSAEHMQSIIRTLWRRLLKYLVGGFSVLTAISVLLLVGGLVKSYKAGIKRTEDLLVKRIDDEFQTDRIRSLMEEVVTQKALARIDATADKVIGKKIRTEIAPRMEATDRRLAEAGEALSRLESLSEFYQLATRLRSDDRKAFDSVMKILSSPSDPRFSQAQALVANLPKEIEILNLLEYQVDWTNLGLDPGKANISAFGGAMGKLQPIYQTKVMETVWKAEHLDKADRIAFLIDVVVSTPSLRCLDKACRLLGDESKLHKNFLAWQEYPKWWEAHKGEYK